MRRSSPAVPLLPNNHIRQTANRFWWQTRRVPSLPQPIGEPILPIDSKAQTSGRLGEAAVRLQFEMHGWTVVRNAPGADFGVDLAVFKRGSDGEVLPYALSVQVKSINRSDPSGAGAASIRVKSSTLASWFWSTTPTICAAYEPRTGGLWWEVAPASVSSRSRTGTSSRTLRLKARLNTDEEGRRLESIAVELWSRYEGARALADLPLVLQVLTEVALDTDLWSDPQITYPAAYLAAATHVYRTAASLNALAGRTGSEEFLRLDERAQKEPGRTSGRAIVYRGRERLGVLYSRELRAREDFVVAVFGEAGSELSKAVPRLQQLAQMAELGIPEKLTALLDAIGDRQLALINPSRAKQLTADQFEQLPDPKFENSPSRPDVYNQVSSPLGRLTLAGSAATKFAP
jgi:hypothetical protein